MSTITARDTNATEHDPMLADPRRAKGFRRRDDPLSRADVLQLVRTQTVASIPPWAVFAYVGSTIAVIISVISYQSTTTPSTVPLRFLSVEMEARLGSRLDAMDKRLARIGFRLDAIENRMDAIETRLERMDAKLDRLLGK
ncbi:hypothetical protein [Cupriavidus sp. H18C1]|uniref:hypothetical protein n=1 Tax=Cupriavidus sp. H18C1 TaxID=3241601 RepID=UPI003BB99665